MVNEYLIQNSGWKADETTMAETAAPPVRDAHDSSALSVVMTPLSASLHNSFEMLGSQSSESKSGEGLLIL